VRQARDIRTGKESLQETFFSDYQETEGVRRARQVQVKRDGKKWLDLEVTDVTVAANLDDQVFAKP